MSTPSELLDKAQGMSSVELVKFARSSTFPELTDLHWYAIALALATKLDLAIDHSIAHEPDTVLAASAAHWEVPTE